MLFRRWRRRRQSPPPVVLPPLDRLAELVERVVVLLDQSPGDLVLQEHKVPPAAPTAAEPEPSPEAPGGHVVFVAGPAGYRLVERTGPAPARSEVLALDEGRFRVLRVGPSPLPGDRRRCAFLEQEAPVQDRTSDG